MRIVRHVCALRVEALVGVCRIVDDLQFSVLVEEAVATLDVAVLVTFFVAELSVIPVCGRRGLARWTLLVHVEKPRWC